MLVALRAGQGPGTFPKEGLRLDFSKVLMSPRLRVLLEGLLEPLVEKRLTADQALAVLRKPSQSRVVVTRRVTYAGSLLEIEIYPAPGIGALWLQLACLCRVLLGAAWLPACSAHMPFQAREEPNLCCPPSLHPLEQLCHMCRTALKAMWN